LPSSLEKIAPVSQQEIGGGGGVYWGMGWGIGPIGLIVIALIVACLLFGYRSRRGG